MTEVPEPTDAEVQAAISVWQLKEELLQVAGLACEATDSLNQLILAFRAVLIRLEAAEARITELENA